VVIRGYQSDRRLPISHSLCVASKLEDSKIEISDRGVSPSRPIFVWEEKQIPLELAETSAMVSLREAIEIIKRG
jgi:hypothetical protein